MNKELVSVIMGVKNAESTIFNSIAPFLKNDFVKEIIIVNDGSADGTSKILEDINNPRLKILNNSVCLGLTKSLNLALDLCTGKYVARQDADDISHPLRIQSQVKYLEENSGTSILATSYQIVNEVGQLIETIYPNRFGNFKKRLKRGNIFCHGSLMFRRDVIQKLRYDEFFETSQDYEILCRAIATGYTIHSLNQPYYSWRLSPSSISVKKAARQKFFESVVQEKYYHRKRKQKSTLTENSLLKEINIHLFAGNYKTAKTKLKRGYQEKLFTNIGFSKILLIYLPLPLYLMIRNFISSIRI